MALTLTQSYPASGVSLFTYDNLDTADSSPDSLLLTGTSPALGFLQAEGVFGSGTVKLQGSNDGINWVDLKDITGVTIGITSDGGVEFSTSAVYIRPLITGGTSDDVNVTISLRG